RFSWTQGFSQRARGDYEYATVNDFVQDQVPTSFAQRSTGNNTYYGDQFAIYSYANEEFRITKNLTFNFGLRYEFTSVPFTMGLQKLNAAASVPGLIDFAEPKSQYRNFLPRVGFAYSPGTAGTTTIRGGFGMAMDVIYDNLGLLAVPPQFGGTCDVFLSINGTGGCNWAMTGFLAGGGLPPGQGTGLQSFPTIDDQRAATANFIPHTMKLPYSETWNLGVEHVFAKKWVGEVRYVGTRGIHLPVQQQLNVQPRVSSSLFLPTFLTPPDAATIAGLTTNLAAIQAQSNIIPAFTNAGFINGITAFQPFGQSIYHGLQTQLKRSFSDNFQMLAAYTWSHLTKNSTPDVVATVLPPRRPQDSQNFAADMSTSAVDRRHRFSLSAIYDVQVFKSSDNWYAKNLLGNWEIAPVWQLQSPEFFTPQSGIDSNLNGDRAPDRTIINPAGVSGTASTVTPICTGTPCSPGNIVGYVADNPNARYIQAGLGALATGGRNTEPTPRTNNWDLTVVKRFNTSETTKLEFAATAFNIFNHSQFIPGFVNRVDLLPFTNSAATAYVPVSNPQFFNDPKQAFANNARTMQLTAKFSF